MKPILFDSGQTDFTTNGLGRLSDAISCTVTEERNGAYELHMEYPIDGHLMDQVTYSRIIYAVPADNKAAQPFRIYRISKPLSGIVEIDAEHISYQLSHIPVMPFTAEGLTPAFTALSTFSAEENPFTFTREGAFGAAIANTFRVTEPDNLRALLFGQEGSIIDIYGGEWEFDGFNVILHHDRGADNGVTIRYGKNLTDLKQEENIENTYTGICPFWKGQDEENGDVVVTLPEQVVHSTFARNFPYQRTKIVDMSSEFTEQPTVEQLRSKAERYVETNDVGTPKVSLDVSFVALHQTQEYAGLTKREHINLCDTVTVIFPALNVQTKAKVVKTVWDVLLDRYETITIGATQGRLSVTLQASQERAVEQAVQQSSAAASTEYATKTYAQALNTTISRVGSRLITVENYVNALQGSKGGYIYLQMNSQYQIYELLVLIDSPALGAANQILRWNNQGLTYTNGGYEKGTWTSVIDGNGNVNGAALTGILSDAAGKHSWNLLTGALSLTEGSVTVGNKSLSKYIGDKVSTASYAIRTALENYDAGLDQAAVLQKLQAGTDPADDSERTDTGLYIGADGLLHMLPERVITDGMNIPVIYLPTVIMDGAVTAYTKARVVNGVIYAPLPEENYNEDPGGDEPGNNEPSDNEPDNESGGEEGDPNGEE